MRAFLQKYRSVLLWFLAWLSVGLVSNVASLIFTSGKLLDWLQKRRIVYILLATFLILILGDSRVRALQFVKDLRIPAILLLGLVALSRIGKQRARLDKGFAYLLPFFVLAFLSLIYSPIPLSGLQKTVSYLLLLIFALHLLPDLLKQSYGQLLLDIAYLFILILGLGLVYGLLRPAPEYGGALIGVFGNPNGLGIFCTLSLPYFALLLLLFPDQRRLLWSAILLTLLCAFLSRSRTTLLALAIFSSGFLAYYWRSTALKLLFWGFILATPFVLNPSFLMTVGRLLGIEALLDFDTLEIGGGRFIAWEFAWPEITKQVFLGKGFDYTNFFMYENRLYLKSLNHDGNMHNSFLTFIMDVGMLGTAIFILFLWQCSRRIPKEANAVAIPFSLAFLISANFESWLTSSLNSYTIIFFLLVISMIHFRELRYLIYQNSLT